MASKVAPDITGADGAAADKSQESQGLRRAVGVWGSYTWGYADVGADVYVALGIVRWSALPIQNWQPPIQWPAAVNSTSCAAWAISGAS